MGVEVLAWGLGDNEAAAGNSHVLQGSASLLSALLDRGQHNLSDVLGGAEAVQLNAVGNFSTQAEHVLVHGGNGDGDAGLGDGAGVEDGDHKGQVVELTAEV